MSSTLDANAAFRLVAGEQKFNYVSTNVLAVGSILSTGPGGIDIGTQVTGQNTGAIAIGTWAGQSAQGTSSIAIGTFAGASTQGQNAVAIGMFAGASLQGSGGVAIGFNAGLSAQGANAIAIGVFAGTSTQAAGSIVINASGATLSGAATNGVFISTSTALGIRMAAASDSVTSVVTLLYNVSTKEVLCSTSYSGALTKTFIIDHPSDADKYLVHACLEGPEEGVYYRGVGEIAEGADSASVVLPSYVVKLAKDFTVQVTAVFNGSVRALNADAVKDGAFTVYGAPGAFNWLVHGSRGAVSAEVVKTSVEVKGAGPYKWIV